MPLQAVGGVEEVQHLLLQSLTRKVEEAEERSSLLEEQLSSEREQYSQKESMYKQNVGFTWPFTTHLF